MIKNFRARLLSKTFSLSALFAATVLLMALVAFALPEDKSQAAGDNPLQTQGKQVRAALEPVQAAIKDLSATFTTEYIHGEEYLSRLYSLGRRMDSATPEQLPALNQELDALKHEALLANPLVTRQPILFITRAQYLPDHHNTETMFQNGEINTGSFRGGGAMKVIDIAKGGAVTTLLATPEGIVRDPEISYDGHKVTFSMRKNPADDYHIYEMNVEGTGMRQLTTGPRLSDLDPNYLPDGRVVFSSTREPKVCQCNRHIQANLFAMGGDGSNITQIGRNTLFEGHPAMLPDGRVMYDRWEYVDKQFGPAFALWAANPDGTNQTLFYGNNSWSPGGIIQARPVPGTNKVVATFVACHDRPWGAICVLDPSIGMNGKLPIVSCWPANARDYLTNRQEYGDGQGGHPSAGQIDNFGGLPVKYQDAYPLSDKYFICSKQVSGEQMGLFLVDVFGNETLLHSEQPGCYDAMPITARTRPAIIPSRIDYAREDGRFYIADVYRGAGMESVKRGTVKTLRVVEAPVKLFWSNGNWNVDATQAPAMNWNCTSNKRILGDVPVEKDGSVYFSCQAGKFIYFQLLDANGMMIRSMRSGTTIQPGETAGCIGCHDKPQATMPNSASLIALRKSAVRIKPWHGAPRDFNYLTEVQPVFDKHCVSCHDYGKPAGEKLNLAGDLGLAFNTSYIELRRRSALRWFPDKPGAPKLLVKAVDDGPPEALPAFAWGSHQSHLADVIRSEHHGVRLDRESVDRIVTWIDLNAPYYGSYATAVPDNAFGRSPLDPGKLQRLSDLTGRRLYDQGSEIQGSQVSFNRPELSPCLAGLKDRNPEGYREAVSIIRSGMAILAHYPREDMPGFKLMGADAQREEKYEARLAEEAKARRALMKAALKK